MTYFIIWKDKRNPQYTTGVSKGWHPGSDYLNSAEGDWDYFGSFDEIPSWILNLIEFNQDLI